MRIFKKSEKPLLHWELFASMIIIVLVIISFVYVMRMLLVGEKRFLGNELIQQTTWAVNYWNETEAMKPDGKMRSHAFNGHTYELYIYVGGKEYTFKIDTTENLSRMYTSIACDMNLRNPMTLACLDSLVKPRLEEDARNIPVVFRRVDSLGNPKEMYPVGNTRYADMDEAGYVRLGYISGEKIAVLFDYSWNDFYKKFWWQVWGAGAVGIIIIALVISCVVLVRRYRRKKELQHQAFRQRLHDLKNPVAAVESTLYNIYLKNPKVFKKQDGRDGFEECAEMLGILKLDMASVLGMASMLHARRVPWKEIRLREEVEKLIAEFELANKGEKKVNVKFDYSLVECLMLSDLFLFALRNLVDNAVKYSGDVVNITIDCHEEGKKIVVSVADQGKGIDKKDLPYIFEEFRRVEGEKKVQGYGLGLAFVKKAVKKHGGEITVKSEPGVGSKFTIKIHYHGKKNKAVVRRRREVYPGELCGNIVRSGV